MDIKLIYAQIGCKYDRSLTVEEAVTWIKWHKLGIDVAIELGKTLTKGDKMKTLRFEIDHDARQVIVNKNAPTKVVQDAGISARNHGYELVYDMTTPKAEQCNCHVNAQMGVCEHVR